MCQNYSIVFKNIFPLISRNVLFENVLQRVLVCVKGSDGGGVVRRCRDGGGVMQKRGRRNGREET